MEEHCCKRCVLLVEGFYSFAVMVEDAMAKLVGQSMNGFMD